MLAMLSIPIASPLDYWLMSQWLEGFGYPTEISGWAFIVSPVSALTIAFLTVSVQGIKAALTSLAETLK